jgi:serine protease Do
MYSITSSEMPLSVIQPQFSRLFKKPNANGAQLIHAKDMSGRWAWYNIKMDSQQQSKLMDDMANQAKVLTLTDYGEILVSTYAWWPLEAELCVVMDQHKGNDKIYNKDITDSSGNNLEKLVRPQKAKKSLIKIFLYCLLALIIFLLLDLCVVLKNEPGEFNTVAANDMHEMLAKVMPAVVTIAVEEENKSARLFGSNDLPASLLAFHPIKMSNVRTTGSGFFIKIFGEPYVITNAHVIDKATDAGVYVYTANLDRYSAKLIGADSIHDIAVLKVNNLPATISPLTWQSSLHRTGDKVYALGSPMLVPNTVSEGVVSVVSKTLRDSLLHSLDFIQHSATLSKGASGGALVDETGDVMGVNSQGMAPQINFAIDSNTARRVAEDLVKYGVVRRPFLGIHLLQLSVPLEKNLTERVILYDVIKGAPAAEVLPDAVLGKELVAINHQEVHNITDAIGLLDTLPFDQDITLRIVYENHQEKTFVVKPHLLNESCQQSIAAHVIKKYLNAIPDEINGQLHLQLNLSKLLQRQGDTFDSLDVLFDYGAFPEGDHSGLADIIVTAAGTRRNHWFIKSLAGLGEALRVSLPEIRAFTIWYRRGEKSFPIELNILPQFSKHNRSYLG